ncbi:hypothetical protein GUJ93_ZPchr0003g16708 [Zizania palustris]|uniref:Uncharacterized protein n=1 Tax=Zizania palustris TaxID=103762 RepID=A0A8J5SKP7_ZIZPA|nr:hypothetical protein GUJ93_ZPchr0003g16708 [Zizania palustris]
MREEVPKRGDGPAVLPEGSVTAVTHGGGGNCPEVRGKSKNVTPPAGATRRSQEGWGFSRSIMQLNQASPGRGGGAQEFMEVFEQESSIVGAEIKDPQTPLGLWFTNLVPGHSRGFAAGRIDPVPKEIAPGFVNTGDDGRGNFERAHSVSGDGREDGINNLESASHG